MTEVYDEQSPERLDIERYFDAFRRRHLHLILPLFITWLLVWGSSWFLQPKYKSSALILVEEPTMPSSYVAPNVNENLQDRLQSITQQILSRTRLLIVINTLHLYGNAQDEAGSDARVAKMQKDINVDLVRDTRNNEITAFRISYSSPDPHVAQQVTSELTNLFISENLKVRQQQSQGTTSFIEQQLEDARQRLAEQEAKVRAFEAAHEGALPTQQSSNLQILAGLQSQLQNEQDTLNTARQQHAYYEALLDQYRTSRGTLRAEALPANVVALDQELSRLRGQLVDLSSRYTDQYPDIQRLKDQIAKTQRMRDELAADPKSKTDEASGSDPTVTTPVGQIQGQLKANQLEISNREATINALKERITEYQGRLNLQPATEQELADITRGYEQSKVNYDDLLKKKNDSVMATSMEQMQQGERFTILDPPTLPAHPSFPNRLKFCGIGLGLGVVVGALFAFAFELMDDRLHNEKDIRTLLPTSVIAEIPQVVIPTDQERARKKLVFGWALTAAVFVTIIAGAVVSFLQG
jgi:polysaccharide chain length determinant protein (PEP-CTERM system associated)